MAEVYRYITKRFVITTILDNGTDNTIYTAPTAKRLLIKNLHAFNGSNIAVTFRVKIGGFLYHLPPPATLPVGGTTDIITADIPAGVDPAETVQVAVVENISSGVVHVFMWGIERENQPA